MLVKNNHLAKVNWKKLQKFSWNKKSPLVVEWSLQVQKRSPKNGKEKQESKFCWNDRLLSKTKKMQLWGTETKTSVQFCIRSLARSKNFRKNFGYFWASFLPFAGDWKSPTPAPHSTKNKASGIRSFYWLPVCWALKLPWKHAFFCELFS